MNLRCAVHVSKFTVKMFFPMLGKVSDGGFLPASLLFSAACLNTTVKHAVFALFTLERSQVGFRKGKITSSGLQAGIRREIWRLPHNQTFGGLTYFSHVSLACLKFIFGWVAATLLLSYNVAQSPMPRNRLAGGLWVPPAHSNYCKVWRLKQGELNIFYPVSALLQVSGHTSVEMSLGFLKHPELEFLAPNPLRSTDCVQRAEQDSDTWAFGGEAETYIKLAVPLFMCVLRGHFTR